MAGLLDLFGPQGGTGLLGNFGGYLNNNQDALMALGLGLASGPTAMEGFRYGMQGLMEGRKSDRARNAGVEFMKDLGGVAGAPSPLAQSPAAPMPPGAAPSPSQAPGGANQFGNAISGIESGGRYDALGPQHPKTGDRAYGKYQVMGANIPQWTQQVLGQPMTPEQFVASPQAQDAVFKAKFGEYASKYGPEGAARAWFAGEGGMNDPNRRDQLGTTVQSYANKFNSAMQPYQVAQAGGGVPGPTAAGPIPGAPASPAGPPQPVPQDQLGAIRNMPIGTVLKWAMNPDLAGPQREVAKEILKARLEDTKMTDSQKDYLKAKVDGFTGSFADFKNNPSFGPTGARDVYDRPIEGWRNPNTQTVTAANSVAGSNQAAPIANVTELRKEVQGLPSYKNVSTAAPVYNSMKEAAGRDNRASDVNMIYGLAKLMDPGSVVRESEMTIAQAVATLPQALQSTVMSQITGSGRLSPEVREAIMGEAHSRMNAYHQMYQTDENMYRGILQRQRMNPDDVLPKFGPYQKLGEAPPPADGATATNPQTGQKIILRGGQWVPMQ